MSETQTVNDFLEEISTLIHWAESNEDISIDDLRNFWEEAVPMLTKAGNCIDSLTKIEIKENQVIYMAMVLFEKRYKHYQEEATRLKGIDPHHKDISYWEDVSSELAGVMGIIQDHFREDD